MSLLGRVFRVSERRACGVMDMPRCNCRYRSRRKEIPGLRMRLLELAAERKRFGALRLYLLLRREGFYGELQAGGADLQRGAPLG